MALALAFCFECCILYLKNILEKKHHFLAGSVCFSILICKIASFVCVRL